jgi:lysophospholipase L1-like esterase
LNAVEELDQITQGKKFSADNDTIVAEGDSWFDYPVYNVLRILRWRHGYRVESVAQSGDTLESITYDLNQVTGLAEKLYQLRDEGIVPRAILLSAGGNDIAGSALDVLLNNSRSGFSPLNEALAHELVAHRLRIQMVSLIAEVDFIADRYFHRRIPIIIHGYDYPVPDGRGYIGGAFWPLQGPWLKPSFDRKGYNRQGLNLGVGVDVMKRLIDEFNAALMSIPREPGLNHVRYVHILGTLSSSRTNYTDDWGNELHPTLSGFTRVAQKFADEIAKTPKMPRP